jgi:hypothetical protein
MNNKARVIAAYLPQFHPIPENDKWWGKGFTEWTNVGKARPLFRGHYQPRIPADLGYYDLRLDEAREAQANLAREYGVEAFCYWHYWFGNGKRLLERPFNEVLKTGRPDFPFCLGWANSSWDSIHYGVDGKKKILIEQKYPGIKDYEEHFYAVLPALLDKRYVKVDGKPFFLIFNPLFLPNSEGFIELWQKLAIKNGLPGIFFVAQTSKLESIDDLMQKGYNSVNLIRLNHPVLFGRSFLKIIKKKIFNELSTYDYEKALKYFTGHEDSLNHIIPSIYPNWDHSPRSGRKGFIITKSTPELFERHVNDVLIKIMHKPIENRFLYIKSWNEWAEGNYMEPDLKFGLGYLEALKKCLFS